MSILPEVKKKSEETKDVIQTLSEAKVSGGDVYDVYKGETLQKGAGKMEDQEALPLGHYGGQTNVTGNVITLAELALNDISSMDAELILVEEKTPKGIIPVEDEETAKKLGKIYDYTVEKIEGLWYYKYEGYVENDDIMSSYWYNIVRSSGAVKGETKNRLFDALSNMKAVPVFPSQNPYQSTWESPNESDEDD